MDRVVAISAKGVVVVAVARSYGRSLPTRVLRALRQEDELGGVLGHDQQFGWLVERRVGGNSPPPGEEPKLLLFLFILILLLVHINIAVILRLGAVVFILQKESGKTINGNSYRFNLARLKSPNTPHAENFQLKLKLQARRVVTKTSATIMGFCTNAWLVVVVFM